MMASRRGFLKLLGIAAVSPAVPARPVFSVELPKLPKGLTLTSYRYNGQAVYMKRVPVIMRGGTFIPHRNGGDFGVGSGPTYNVKFEYYDRQGNQIEPQKGWIQ